MSEIAANGCAVKDPLSITALYTFAKQKFSDGYFFNGESHDFYEAVCVLKGRVGITAGKRVYVLTEGQMTIHRPGQFHAIWEEGASCPESIIFSFSALPFPKITDRVYELTPELIKEIKSLYAGITDTFEMKSGEDASLVRAQYRTEGRVKTDKGIWVGRISDGKEPDAALLVKRLEIFLLSALGHGKGELSEYNGTGKGNYTRILSVMEENINNDLTVSALAAMCDMSVPALEKTVYRYLHCGAMAYYNVLRLHKAYKYLAAGMSVKETALTLGYANQNYFSACFKKRYGYPPSEVGGRNKNE
jgi:AraC-like DNA-binding protein